MQVLQEILHTLAGIIASFLLFWGSLFSGVPLPASEAPVQESVATSTVVETKPEEKNGPASSTPTKEPAQKSSDLLSAPKNGAAGQTFVQTPSSASSTTPPATAQAPVAPAKSEEQINVEARAALVNILCLSQAGINGASGSGVIIDSRGVILTNAHVAQYFLLRNYLTPGNINCVVRTGSPAQSAYTATLLYLPPVWITDNAAQLKAAQATGTGENDFAFLLITGRTNPSAALPASFDRLPMDRAYADIGRPMLLAAYPAGFLGSETVQKSLYISSAIAYVTQLFSFKDTQSVDLFSIGGTVVSQGGSSGGAAVRLGSGTLAGIITTETAADSTSERDLRAISLAHIDDALIAAGQGGITGLLSGDLSAKAANFNTTVSPMLTAQLEAALKGN